jgi:hypothetical protein
MPIIFLATLASAAAATLPAPITKVTVYSDRARVTRTAHLNVNGVERVELPLLVDRIDPGSILVEASGAEVRRVDIEHVDADDFPRTEARELLGELEKLDDQIARAQGDRAAAQAILAAVRELKPSSNSEDSLRPIPKLNPSAWSLVLTFVADWSQRLQERSRDLDEKLIDLDRERARLRERAQKVGGAGRRAGWRVTPQLAGHGAARVTLTYFVTNARWYPSYDLQLWPDKGQVQVSFSGQVSQESGEDWDDAQLVLSTAVPATSVVAPRLLTWKIGDRERFIPTPVPAADNTRPPPSAQPLPVAEREDESLRRRLLAYAGAVGGDGKAVTEPETVNGFEDRDGDGIPDVADRCVGDESSGGDADGCPSADKDQYSVRLHDLEKRTEKLKEQVMRARQRMNLQQDIVLGAKTPEPPPPPAQPADVSVMRAPPAPARRGVLAGAPAVRHRSYESAGEMAAEEKTVEIDTMSETVVTASGSSTPSDEYVRTVEVGLAPPSGYRAPTYAPDLPASLAGGYDLFFPSLRPETIKSGQGKRRVALFAEAWPVSVERRLYPALAPEAFLVAEIKNPSGRVLPGGPANLFVGADPAGVATLKVSAPGEAFTLPLGIDRAVKPIRNVKLVLQEKGVVFKDEVNQYQVSTEVANPYPGPLNVRIYDQLPLSTDKNVEVRLLRNDQVARVVNDSGQMEWQLTIAPRSTVAVTFVYSLRRPKGWRLHQ